MSFNCETCGKATRNNLMGHTLFMKIQKVSSTQGYSHYQCDKGSLVDNHNWQHWGCSDYCMIEAYKECLKSHYNDENLLEYVPISEVRLHKLVLNSSLKCKVCNVPLVKEAYRFCLRHALPINRFLDRSEEDLEEWTCSLEHAKQNALSNIEKGI